MRVEPGGTNLAKRVEIEQAVTDLLAGRLSPADTVTGLLIANLLVAPRNPPLRRVVR